MPYKSGLPKACHKYEYQDFFMNDILELKQSELIRYEYSTII
jgi:hypothetical protein